MLRRDAVQAIDCSGSWRLRPTDERGRFKGAQALAAAKKLTTEGVRQLREAFLLY
jgi:hypothetical protein